MFFKTPRMSINSTLLLILTRTVWILLKNKTKDPQEKMLPRKRPRTWDLTLTLTIFRGVMSHVLGKYCLSQGRHCVWDVLCWEYFDRLAILIHIYPDIQTQIIVYFDVTEWTKPGRLFNIFSFKPFIPSHPHCLWLKKCDVLRVFLLVMINWLLL